MSGNYILLHSILLQQLFIKPLLYVRHSSGYQKFHGAHDRQSSWPQDKKEFESLKGEVLGQEHSLEWNI